MSALQSSTVCGMQNGYGDEMVKKKKAEKVKPKIRWWKLKETSCQEAVRQEVTRILVNKDGLPDEWNKTAKMLKKQLKLYWE